MKWSVFWRIGQACWSYSNNNAFNVDLLHTHQYIRSHFFVFFKLNFRVIMRIWRKFLSTWAIIVAKSSSESTHHHFKLHKMRSEINEFRLTPNHQLVIVALNLPAYHFTLLLILQRCLLIHCPLLFQLFPLILNPYHIKRPF